MVEVKLSGDQAELGPTQPRSRRDDWLWRGAQVAQILLFLFAGATYWFQFVPLQKIATLDALVEAKEQELKARNLDLERTYSNFRTLTVRQIAIKVIFSCTGTDDPANRRAGYIVMPTGLVLSNQTLMMDIAACIKRAAQAEKAFSRLREEDKTTFFEMADAIALAVMPENKRARERVAKLPELARRHAKELPALEGTEAQLAACYEKAEPKGVSQRFYEQRIVESEQMRIVREYVKVVVNKLDKLGQIEWSNTKTLRAALAESAEKNASGPTSDAQGR